MAKLDELVVELNADIRGLRSQLATADRSVKNTADNTVTNTRRMSTAFRAVGTALAALGVARIGKSIVNTTALFEQLEARLITATGSVESASLAFSQLTEFTSQTPFQVQSVVDAFIELRQQGIQPTFEQFRAMGDAAAATGNDITRFSGAVVGALVGETERLKAFGIITRIEGEKISFTFDGVTRTVNRNATEIVEALTEMSQQNFAGGMERQMDTLGGAFSNLQDAVSVLSNTIGEELSPSITKGTSKLTEMISEVNKALQASFSFDAVMIGLYNTFFGLNQEQAKLNDGILKFGENSGVMVNKFAEINAQAQGVRDKFAQVSQIMSGEGEGDVIGGGSGKDEVEEDPAITRQQRIDEIMAEMDEKEKEDALRREAEFQRKLTKFKEAGASERIRTASSEIQNIIGSAASGNKTLFQINKAAALAQAALDARESVVSAYKFGTKIGGPFLGSTFAGIAAAAQAANIAQIANTSFSGGGSAPSVGTAPTNQFGQRTDVGGPAGEDGGGQNVNLTITGSDKLTRAIAQSINTAVEDGVNLRVN